MRIPVISTLHTVEKREILSHQKIFRQINSLVTYLVIRYFHEFFSRLINLHNVEINGNLSRIFGKISVKVTDLLNKLLKS